MKPRNSPGLFLVLTICALVIAPAKQSFAREHVWSPSARGEGGRVMMKFSPTVGINVGVSIRIDGRNAGAITRGHVVDRYIPRGRHVLSVSRNGRSDDVWHEILNVGPGQTYAYLIKYRVNQIVLQRVAGFR